MKRTPINPRPHREPTAISLPNASRKPPEVYEGEYGAELIYQLDEALRLQNNTYNAKVAMLNDAVLDIGVAIVQGVQNKFVRTLPGQKPIYYHPMEPIEPYQPKPAYESMMLNAGYEAELPL